jgi:nitric oxide reductase subunit C
MSKHPLTDDKGPSAALAASLLPAMRIADLLDMPVRTPVILEQTNPFTKGGHHVKTISGQSVVLVLLVGAALIFGAAPAAMAQQKGDADSGKKIYEKKKCDICHLIAGKGKPAPGPDLTKQGTKNRGVPWTIAFLKDPKSKNPKAIMPPYKDLTEKEYLDLATHMESLK